MSSCFAGEGAGATFLSPGSRAQLGNQFKFSLAARFWWGGRLWPPYVLAVAEARPTEIFLFLPGGQNGS